jgi:hypothetical protein
MHPLGQGAAGRLLLRKYDVRASRGAGLHGPRDLLQPVAMLKPTMECWYATRISPLSIATICVPYLVSGPFCFDRENGSIVSPTLAYRLPYVTCVSISLVSVVPRTS